MTTKDGAEIAYAVSGAGPPLVLAPIWVSDLVRDWADPAQREFIEMLGETHSVVRLDRPGVGQSGRTRTRFSIESEAEYLAAVIEDVDLGPVSIFASSCGGPGAMRLAAERPDDVTAMVLYASYLAGTELAPGDAREALVALVRSVWGAVASSALAGLFKPGATREDAEYFAEYQRDVASADMAADLLQLTYDLDGSPYASRVRCPVLVMCRAGDRAINPRCSPPIAEAIPDAEFVQLDGVAHMPYDGDAHAVVREVEQFLVGQSSRSFTTRELTTVMFTDIVDSTPTATALGDDQWRSRLEQHDELSRRVVESAGGRMIKSTGDGVVATFPLPSQALSCARALHREIRRVGLELTVGLHTGEIERRGDDIAGIAVNVAARVEGVANAGQTLTTQTVRDLAGGSGFTFVEATTTELKGVDGSWVLFSAS